MVVYMAEQTGRRLRRDNVVPPSGAGGDASEDTSGFAAGVGERIRALRQQHGWTQVELAEVAALSPNYIARLERGELGASLYVASRIAEALGTSIDKLAAPAARAKSTKRRVA